MAMLLSLVMVMTMGLTVFAAEGTNSLTITNEGETTHTFQLYQIFTGDLSKGTLSNIKWGDGVTEAGIKALGDASEKADALGTDDDKGRANAKDFAEALVAGANGASYLQNPTEKSADKGSTAVFSDLKAGYYLVMDQANSQNGVENGATTAYIMQVVGQVKQSTKLDVPAVVKKVQDKNDSTGEPSGWQDSADYDIGDSIPYQITGTMPKNIGDYSTYKYEFTDTMSKGLTYAKDATIMIGTKNVTDSFTQTITPNKDGSTTVKWACGNLKGIDGVSLDAATTVVVSYTATLNANAVIGSKGNPNTVNLTYSNNPNKGGDGETGKTPDDKNIVFTYKAVVNKIDGEKNPLKGADFTLEKKDSSGNYVPVVTSDGTKVAPTKTTNSEGTTFTFTGLDDGEYRLSETTTPAGYNTIEPIIFKITASHDETADDPKLQTLTGTDVRPDLSDTDKAHFTSTTTGDDDGAIKTDIVNKKGSILPSTGGRGTTMIYIIGAALVVTAGVVLVMRKKMNSDK
jgi:fimbrial isopeptide formation D2 family protein/LPXTG-motif cell wall-anchored protein